MPGQEVITLKELGETCRKTKDCLKCEQIEFCSSYARFMNGIAPKWWLAVEAQYGLPLPDLKLSKDGYKLERRGTAK